MAQIGYEKVRTGCVTCKQRRVKCDEAKPTCNRCRKAGKECRGYQEPTTASYSWTELLCTKPSIIPPTTNDNQPLEMRSLEFFRLVVAPNISGPTTVYLWTASILQLSIQDATARNAVLAISLLYEASLEASDSHAPSHPQRRQQKIEMASRYYGRSLRCVAGAAAADLDAHLVLFLSILYMSIDFLRGHESGAVAHCRHALRIAQSSARPPPLALAAVLSHLNVFPFFFGATLCDFPLWFHGEDRIGGAFTRVYEVSASLDRLMARTVGLLREFDPFRLTACGDGKDKDTLTGPHPSLIARWSRLRDDLGVWSSAFFASKRSQQKTASQAEMAGYRMLEMRWLVTKIWADCLGKAEETAYDAHRGRFERIVELAREEGKEKPARSTSSTRGFEPVFRFEMGVLPLLHFVTIKCRDLKLRVEALMLTRRLACPREALWDAPRTYAIGKRIVEREHGIEVAPCGDEMPSSESVCDKAAYALPADNRRAIIFFIYDDSQSQVRRVKDWIQYPRPPPSMAVG